LGEVLDLGLVVVEDDVDHEGFFPDRLGHRAPDWDQVLDPNQFELFFQVLESEHELDEVVAVFDP
jgi:hypothetical protein